MKFLAISTNLADPTPHIPAEIARTTELMEAGVLEQALLKADRSGAVLVLDVPDAATARAAVDSLPLVRYGVTRFDLTELMEVPTPHDRRRTGAGAAPRRHRIQEDRCIRRGAARAGMIARIASPAVRRTGHRPALSSQAR